jgi:transcriptional regulator with XRE-family HTH domain
MIKFYHEETKMITIEQIQERMAEAIKQSGLTQTELAKRLGVRHQQISCYLKGQKMPALDTFAKLCAVVDADANEILCISEYKDKK